MSISLALALAMAGVTLPATGLLGGSEGFTASVTLGVDAHGAEAPSAVLGSALRDLRTAQMLGRAVDILGLDRDPEFSGTASTALGVAMELVTGESAGPANARSRAIENLGARIAIERKDGADTAGLTVHASSPEKALKIAEALATVYAAGSEATGAIPGSVVEAASDRLKKAEAGLADFTAKAGADKLSATLVLKSRMDGLDQHIAQLSSAAEDPSERLGKASLKDILDGRLEIAAISPDLDAMRQAYVNAKLASDALAQSLGPKHPRLLAAQSETEAARKSLTDQFARVKKQLARAEEQRKASLRALKAERDDLSKQIAASGIDLARHGSLEAEVQEARAAIEAANAARSQSTQPVYQASRPKLVEEAASWLSGRPASALSVAAGIAALGVAAWLGLRRKPDAHRESLPVGTAPPVDRMLPSRAHMEPVAGQPQPVIPVVEPLALLPEHAWDSPAMDERGPVFAETSSIALQLASIQARRRQLDAANRIGPRPEMTAPPLSPIRTFEDLPRGRSRLGLDRLHPEDLPLVEKLRQVAPRVFADPVEEAEIERLREELAELRARVIRRVSGAA